MAVSSVIDTNDATDEVGNTMVPRVALPRVLPGSLMAMLAMLLVLLMRRSRALKTKPKLAEKAPIEVRVRALRHSQSRHVRRPFTVNDQVQDLHGNILALFGGSVGSDGNILGKVKPGSDALGGLGLDKALDSLGRAVMMLLVPLLVRTRKEMGGSSFLQRIHVFGSRPCRQFANLLELLHILYHVYSC